MRMNYAIVATVFFLALSGCNDDNNNGSVAGHSGVTAKSGILGVPPISGMSYKTATQQGVTDSAGRFSYQEGERVTFSIGTIVLPAVAARTPIRVDDFGASGNDQVSRNIRRLLITLDADGNPANGIAIEPAARAAASNALVDFSQPTDAGFEASVANYLATAKPANPVLLSLNSENGGTGSVQTPPAGGGSASGGAGDNGAVGGTPTTLEAPRRLTPNAAPVESNITSDDGAGYVFAAIAGRTYTITVTPKTALDDPDLFVFRTLQDLRSYWAVEAANIAQGAADSPAATALRVAMSINEAGMVETGVFVAEKTGDYFIMLVDTGDKGNCTIAVTEQ